jgi:hypothetical protein
VRRTGCLRVGGSARRPPSYAQPSCPSPSPTTVSRPFWRASTRLSARP